MNLIRWIKHIARREPARKVPEVDHGRRTTVLLYALCLPIAFLLSASLSLLVQVDIPQYKLGDIARSDVVIPSDIFVKDDAATRAKQLEAREKSPAVYRYDSTAIAGIFSRISNVLLQCRRLTEGESSRKNGRRNSRLLSMGVKSKMLPLLRELTGQSHSDDFLSFVIKQNANSTFENKLIVFLKQAYPAYVVEDDSAVPDLPSKLYLADIKTGKMTLMQAEKLLKIDEVRAALHDELTRYSDIPEEWKPYVRQIVDALVIPNISFDIAMTAAKQEEAASDVEPVLKKLKKGKIILRQGDEISPSHIIELKAIRDPAKVAAYKTQFIGWGFIITLSLFIFLFMMRFMPLGQWRYTRLAIFCLATLVINIVLLQSLWFTYQSLSRNFLAAPFNQASYFLYALPYAWGSMLVALLAGESCAGLFILIFSLIASQAIGVDVQDTFYVLLSGMIGLLLMSKVVQRVGIIWAGLKLGFAAILLFLLLQLVKHTHLDAINLSFGAVLAFASGPLNAFFIMFALPLFEYMFMVTTEIRLSEMSNLNLPLVRDLIVKAPGTYNHSIVVGTLCEGAAKAIGQNPLFLRVASLYHDIGKTMRPEYFAENQNNSNPHDSLSPDESVSILKAHVSEGAKMAQKAKLPPAIVDLIIQHHGTRLMHFFHDKAKKGSHQPAENFDDAFRYEGPKPQTKGACILMLADSIEAACRTLKDHSRESILTLIQNIIGDVTGDGQFSECDITLAEMDHIAFSFLETLESYYHERVAYPEFDTAPPEKSLAKVDT